MQSRSQLDKLSPERLELIARMIQAKKGSAATASPFKRLPRSKGGIHSLPLSFAQERLWFLDLLDPGLIAYNEPSLTRIRGDLRHVELERAFEMVAERHEALRTTFRLDGEMPVQVVAPPSGGIALPRVDLRHLPQHEREREARSAAVDVARRPFNLVRGPLLRAVLYRLAEDEHLLMMVFHHIVADGWSYYVIVRELGLAYSAFVAERHPALAPLPVQYGDFASWQREWLQGEVLERQLTYWRKQLAGAPEVIELPTDRPRAGRSLYRGGQVPLAFSPALYQDLQRRAKQEGVTLFVLFLAAYQILLRSYSGSPDVVVGMPVAGRSRTEIESLVGFFVNMLVLRGDLRGELPLADLLGKLRQVTLDALEHQDLPFDRLVQEIQAERNMGYNPLFQVTLAFQNALPGAIEMPGLSLRREGIDIGTSRFDLIANLYELDDRLEGWLEYDSELFDPVTAVRMAGHFHALLVSLGTVDVRSRLSVLSLLDASERHQLQSEWNDTEAAYTEGICLHQLFERQADRSPEAVAARFAGESLTYRDLDRASNRLAHRLRASGVGPEAIVGILLDRSLEMVVALLGVLKAGGAYLPLDPSYPKDRLSFFVADSAPRIVLTTSNLAALVPAGSAVVCLDTEREAIAAQSGERLGALAGPDHLAYVIYTSGSTGRPKGAMNAHKGVVNRILWMQEAYRLGAADRVLQKTPFSFDVSVWEFFWPLAVGARLVVALPGGHRDPAYLTGVIESEAITTLHFVPSMLRVFLEADGVERCVSVRRVMASGEELTAEIAARFFERLGGAKLHNLYGPTEAAVDVTAWDCRRERNRVRVPIGRPITNLRIHLADREGQPSPVGVAGELFIGGTGVGRGYLGRPELTAERFVPDPWSPAAGARLYRTGDLARYRPDGAIDFLGRTDHQVKIRGFRIELQEIESVLKRSPAVAEAVVLAREHQGDLRLVAYLVVQAEETPAAAHLRDSLRGVLPEYMVPASFVFLDAMPLNPNGKLDRKALPEPDDQPRDAAEFVPPRTYTEELLAGLWAQVLGLDRLSAHANPFDLGAHSLMATRVLTRINREFGTELPLRTLFELPTIARLAAEVERQRGAARERLVPPMHPVPRDGMLPLSFAQQRLWFLDRWEPGSAAFTMPTTVHLDGDLDLPALTASLHEIIRRHETLRTRFLDVGGEPVQVIDPFAPHVFPLVDLAGIPGGDLESERERLVHGEARRPFDLARGPLLRATLLRCSTREHLALLTMSHIVFDGWSLSILTREMSRAYEAFATGLLLSLPELPIQFADFAFWQRQWLQGEVLERELAFWKDHLAGAPDSLDLPFDRPRGPVQRYRGERRTCDFPPELPGRLAALSRIAGGTLFMTLLAGWKTLLWRYSNQADLTTGTVIANRHRREVENLIGLFINTLVLRTRLQADLTSRQAIQRIREVMLDVYAHQDVPFEKLVEELNPERHLSLTPLFQVMLILQNTPSATLELPGLRLTASEVERNAVPYDLLFTLEEDGEELHGVLEYDVDLFDGATISRMLTHFSALLGEMVGDPDRRLLDGSLLAAAERQQLLLEWNDTERPSGSPARTFCEMFEEQVTLRPAAWAAACGEKRISYRDLAERVDRTARALTARGVGRDHIVPVLMDRGIGFLATILSILRCGAAYLPLAPAHPERRIGQILESSRARLVVAARGQEAQIAAACGTLPPDHRPGVEMEEDLLAEPRRDTEPERGLLSGLAYVIFTSGSTGQPKGVMVELAGLLNNVRSKVEDLPLSEHDVVAQTASQCFDISVWQFLAVLAAGGMVRIVPDEIAQDSWSLLKEVESRGITVLEIVPSLLQAVLDEVDRLGPARPALAKLRWVMPTGEAVPSDLCRRWLAAYPGIPLLNLYGPSECSDDVSTLAITQGWEAGSAITPIGRPLRNARLHVLDPQLDPVPMGVAGELAIGGICLGRGYLFDSARTAEAFAPDGLSGEPGARIYRTGDFARYLADGRVEFLGRMDRQVKVRGFRIEIGEIESALRQHDEVGQAVVMARSDGGAANSARLVGYVVPAAEGADSSCSARLRAHLAERLPDYMVPTLFVLLDHLPLSPNGKVDYRALPAPEVLRGNEGRTTPPRTPTEKVLAEIWREVLGVGEVGIEDSFFDLGGHSLLATRVLSRLRAELDVDLALRELFEARDLQSLAAAVDAARDVDLALASLPILPAPPGDLDLLSFAQERLWFLDQFDPGSPAYNLANAVLLLGEISPSPFVCALNEIVRRHATLRMTFDAVAGRPRQIVHPHLTLKLPEVDLSALPALRVEEETIRWGTFDARRPFDLEHGPLVRATLLRRGPAEHVLLLTMHHIASDGWSMAVFLSEVAALYPAFAEGRPSPLPELSIQYTDYARWQRDLLQGDLLDRQLAYWKEQLAGAPEALDLPGRPSRPAVLSSKNGGIRRFRLPAALSQQVKVLGRQQGSTLFMTLLTGFAVLLHRYSGASDLMIGIPVAGRSRTELEPIIGFFVNSLVVRVRLAGDPSSEELLQRVRRASLDAFTHQDLPFEKLVAEINPERDLDRSPLFQVMFALQNAPAGEIDLPGLTLSRFQIDTGTIRFELYLELMEDGEELEGSVQFSRDLFDSSFIARLVEHFQALLQGMRAHTSQSVDALPLLSGAEQAQILRDWNDSAKDVPLDVPFERLFARSVARHAGRIAVSCEGRSLTYTQLNGRANALAGHLIERGMGPEGVVAILAERGLDFLTAVVGTFKAGAAYLPLDPRHPANRIRQVLEQSRCSLVLSAGALQPLVTEAVEGLAGERPAILELEPLAAGWAAEDPPARGGAEHLAYIIFTSGSTGMPKGAMLVQRGLVNHLFAMIEELGLTDTDAVAQTASQCFDISVWQFLTSLLTGGRVEIYPDAVAQDPEVLLDRVEADGVRVLEIVPSLLRLILEEVRRRGTARPALAELRWLIPTGEAVPPELCREWQGIYPHVGQVNGYGPAECSDDVILFRIRSEESSEARSVPIGRPILNTEIYVLDPALRPVPLRVAGELCIGGSGVGRGYLFDPAKTAAAFAPNPCSGQSGDRLYRTGDLARFREDGNLEFLGRFDHQVKIRGFRLELGEIEAVLGEHPALSGVVVMARREAAGSQRLVAYVVGNPEAPAPQELREFLKSRLPEYAIPSAWVTLESFPLSPNGKVDRRALPEADGGTSRQDRSYVAPRSEMEEAVAEIFAAVIGREKVGIFDNFFELGGHSLLATQATWRLRESFGVELALRVLFEAPTVAELAGVIEDRIIEQIESLSDDEVDELFEPAAEDMAASAIGSRAND